MAEPVTVDVSVKPLASTKPAASPTPKPTDKATAPPATIAPPATPPAPGSRTFLGWLANGVTNKQLAICASAVFSLVAGIAAVRLIWPEEEQKPTTTATAQLVVSEPKQPLGPPAGSHQRPPTVAIEQSRPGDNIPPAGLYIPGSPVSPPGGPPPILPATPKDPPPPASFDTPLPLIPLATPGPGVLSVAPVVPASGTGIPPGPGMPMSPAAPGGGALPAIPPATPPGSTTVPPVSPVIPSPPGSGVSVPPPPADLSGLKPPPPADLSGLKPPPPADLSGSHGPAALPPVTGSAIPPFGPGSTLPPIPGFTHPVGPTTPPPPVDLGMGGNGATLQYSKQPNTPTVTPIAGSERTPTTSYDVDIYEPKASDTWDSISREFYNDAKYATALRAYNRNKPLTGGTIDVPPIHVLRRTAAPPPSAGTGVGTGTPVSRSSPAPDPWGPPTAPVSTGGGKTFRIPEGGMSLRAVARYALGTEQRWDDIYRLNPEVAPDKVLPAGTDLKMPPDARFP
jgi:hypothetical protein